MFSSPSTTLPLSSEGKIRVLAVAHRLGNIRPDLLQNVGRATLEDVTRANQVLLSKPGRPDSAHVGTSGTLRSRLGPALSCRAQAHSRDQIDSGG
jgi:hypothetical protein